MKYYKELDIDCTEVSTKILNYLQNKQKDYLKGFWTNADTIDVLNAVPELQELFDHLNIKIKKISFVTSFQKIGMIHIDDVATAPNARINLPIKNCEGSETIFYTSSKPTKLMKLPSGIVYYGLEDEHCQRADSFTLKKPTVIRPKELHQVVLHDDNIPRISCTLEFYEDIEGLL